MLTATLGMDVGCGAKILSGEIKVKSGTSIQKFTTKTLEFADGSSLEADAVIFAQVDSCTSPCDYSDDLCADHVLSQDWLL